MLRGIDISNWQAGLDADAVFPNVDFVICKATEGVGFVDGYCDSEPHNTPFTIERVTETDVVFVIVSTVAPELS